MEKTNSYLVEIQNQNHNQNDNDNDKVFDNKNQIKRKNLNINYCPDTPEKIENKKTKSISCIKNNKKIIDPRVNLFSKNQNFNKNPSKILSNLIK